MEVTKTFKVAELDELLRAKGKTVKGMKAQKAMEVAWCYTKEEIATWRRQRQTTEPPALMLNRGSRQPTLDEQTQFAHNIYMIKSEELGEVITKLDQHCPTALDKMDPEKDELEINIDSIDPKTFHLLDRMIRGFLPDTAKKPKKKKADDSSGGSASKKAKGS